jgi:hypothetical protein
MSGRVEAGARAALRPGALAAALLAALAGSPAQADDGPAPSPSAASIKNLQAARDARDAREARDARDLRDSRDARPAAAPRDPAVSTSAPRARRPVLRCWQEGRLVFEGAGVAAPAALPAGAVEMRAAGGAPLLLLDLKSGLCLLDAGADEGGR